MMTESRPTLAVAAPASAGSTDTPALPPDADRVGADGDLALRFYCDGNGDGDGDAGAATRVDITAQRPPLRVVRGFQQEDGSALVHLHNISGGVLGGDQLTLFADVAPGVIEINTRVR